MADRNLTRIYIGKRWDNWVRQAFFGRADPGPRYTEDRIAPSRSALVGALQGAAKRSDVIVISPDHASAVTPGFYLENDPQGCPSLSLMDLHALAPQVDLSGKTVVLGACCSAALTGPFLSMGARCVYGTTVPDFSPDWWAIQRHLDSGEAVPSTLVVHASKT